MSARALPVASRLSRLDLRVLRDLRDGKPTVYSRRTAERLSPVFVDVQVSVRQRHVRGGTITDAGREALKLHGR